MGRGIQSIWEAWAELEIMVKKNDLLLLCDYDGTLAPIVSRPSLAALPTNTRNALRLVSRKKRVAVGIVSGRPLREVRKLIGLKRLSYIGSHGYEISMRGRPPQTQLSPQQSQCLKTLARDLERILRDFQEVWIERKAAGVAVHYREAKSPTARCALNLLRFVAQHHKQEFRVQKGQMVFEFVPAGNVTKGTAVRELARQLRLGPRTLRIYLGDDFTDESVFAGLRKRDFGIVVGDSGPSAARYSLSSPQDVSKFLDKLGGITR